MTAEDTALRLVRWATSDLSDAMPEGDLANAAGLAQPGQELLTWMGRLAAVTAARLRLAEPLLGDRRPPTVGPGVLAAAIGAFRHGQQATLLLRALRSPQRGSDLLAHHGLVAPAVRLLPQLSGSLLDVSPLTGVLDRPGPRTTGACENLLDRLRQDPSAKTMIMSSFADSPDSPAQARWRGECLAWIRHEDPLFVVGVYERAMQRHGAEYEIAARSAWRRLLGPGPDESVLATAAWWRALAEIEVAAGELIRGRSALAGRRVGTNLFRRVQQLEHA